MRVAWVPVLLSVGIAAADPRSVDPELANGSIAAKSAGMVGITLDAEPTRELLALLGRFHIPATFFVPPSYWDRPDPELLVLVHRADARFGLLLTDSDARIDIALMHAERAGHRIGVFRALRPLGSARRAALLAGLTQVAPTRATNALHSGGAIVHLDPRTLAATLDELERRNCERLARNERLVTPVSLHYFVRDRGRMRAIPEHVQAQTAAYRDRLADDCEDRAAARQRGNFPHSPRPRGDFAPCTVNPLAKGCM